MNETTKRPPGRPKSEEPIGRRITVYLRPDIEAKALEIGGGVLSHGITTAVRKHRIRKPAGGAA